MKHETNGLRFPWKQKFIISLKVPIVVLLVVFGLIPMILSTQTILTSMKQNQIDARMIEVQNQCQILSSKMTRTGYLDGEEKGDLSSEIETMADVYNGRIVVVNRDFRVVQDTFHIAENRIHIAEEVIRCFQGENSSRYNKDKHFFAQAIPIYDRTEAKGIDGVLIITASTETILGLADTVGDKALLFEIIVFLILVIAAFLAAVLIAPLFALLGTMAVNNKMAFFSDALGHSAFTGIGLGVLLGMQEPLLAMLAFGIFLGLVITKVKSANMVSSDTVISVFSSAAMALGIVILSASGGFAKYSSYLIGDILTVGRKDLWTIGIVLVAAYALWALLYNQLLLLSVNRSLAASRGVRVMLVENIFVIMVAVAVMVSIRWVGILMINSLLILPAAAARNVTSSAGSYHWTATVFGLLSSVVGLWISYSCSISAGATMVLTAAVLFFLTYLIGKSRK